MLSLASQEQAWLDSYRQALADNFPDMIEQIIIYGSKARGDAGPESDIDVLVSLEPDAPWSLWEWVDMKEELTGLFGREVDLVEKDGLRNPFRRYAILTSKQVIYAAD